jgi:riboflavin kinase/FMN adenylyltransferase
LKIKVIHSHSLEAHALKNSWLTVGIFDGVHRGHQKLLRELIRGAHAEGIPAVVLTFTPHPAVILGGKIDFKCITTLDERLTLLEKLGVDMVITQNFNREFAAQTAEEFMKSLVRYLGLRRLFTGYDTAIGRGREGNSTRLTEIGKELGFTVESVPPVANEKGVISSTRIRNLIETGNVSVAAADLGRYYDISGLVIHGDGRGHKINIPTANIHAPTGKVIPCNGIYACWARLEKVGGEFNNHQGESKQYMAAINVGIRPTFTPNLLFPTIEAHLLDYTGNLYGQHIRIEFVQFLRHEVKYSSVQALVKQIRKDISRTREILV